MPMPRPAAAAANPRDGIQETCPVLSSWAIPSTRPITAHAMVHSSIVSCNCRSFDFLMRSAPKFQRIESIRIGRWSRVLQSTPHTVHHKGLQGTKVWDPCGELPGSLEPVDEQGDDERVGEIDEERA